MKEAAEGDLPEVASPPREAPTTSPRAANAPPLTFRTRLLIRVAGWVLFALGRTWRVRVYGRRALLARHAEAPRAVIAFWHGQLLIAAWTLRQPTRGMISEHRDGELIAHLVSRLGVASIRGSSSRGGARALLECVRVLRQGADIAITPDGPRGPRHRFAPGALVVAYRAQRAIVPVGAHIDRAWRLRSWDQFEIPKPFARVTMVYGAPMAVEGTDVRDVSARVEEFASAIHAVTARAAALAREA